MYFSGSILPFVFFSFWVFRGIIGGTPGKRISEGQFQALYGGPLIKVFMRFYFDGFVFYLGFAFSRHYRGDP